MTRDEYLRQLRKYLKRLPKDDYDSAMEYFTEYFEEAGLEGEQRVIQELGSPRQAAAELLGNLLDETTSKKQRGQRSVGSIVLIALMAIFAAPIGIPLLIVVGVLMLTAVIVAIACAVCVLLFGLAGVLIGGKMVLRGLVAMTVSPAGAAVLTGAGLVSIGMSVLLSVLLMCACKWIALSLIGWIRNLISRRGGEKR